MPRVQDAIPSLDRRAWKGRSNPLLLSTLRFAPESRAGRPSSKVARGRRKQVRGRLTEHHVNRLLSLTPPLSDNSKSCRADRHSDPTPNDSDSATHRDRIQLIVQDLLE